MRTKGLLLSGVIILVFGWFTLSWAQCPEDPNDRGECDTLNVICMDCEIDTSLPGPYIVQFPILITHDLVDYIDSISGIVIPLAWTHTNPAAYCSVSSFWNTTLLPYFPNWEAHSIFRDLETSPGDTLFNWMADLARVGQQWSNIILALDGTANFWLTLIPTTQPQLGSADRLLIATMTFKTEDTMHVCIDSTFLPPNSHLTFVRADGATYVPRDNLPYCFWLGQPRIQITSPDGGEVWIVDETYDITWISENFYGENVDIEFSTDGGTTWAPIVENTPNDGVHPWLIPDATSDSCKVKVSDADDGDPYDESDSLFSIIFNPYFTMDAVPDTEWVKQGDTTHIEVILTSMYGFDSPCTLTITGLPPLATCEFDPPALIPTDTSILTIVIDSLTPLDSYVLTITGTEITKQVTDSVKVVLHVLSSINWKPEISVPGPLTVYAGLQVTFPVIATDADTSDTLTLTKSGVGEFPCYPRVSPVVCYFQWTTEEEDTLNSPYTVIFTVDDGRDSTDTGVVEITVLPYNVLPSGTEGDVTGDNEVSVDDVVFLIRYLFMNEPPPNPPVAGDVNGDCFVGLSDIIWLINYLFRFGPPPQIRCLPGDFNYDGYVDLLDPIYFIDYMAYEGPAPVSMRSTDVNTDCFINAVDMVYEIKYLLRGGEAPQPGCVEPKEGMEKPAPPSIAEVGFSELGYDQDLRAYQIPVYANLEEPVAGVELRVSFDPDEVALLPPTLTSRTENLELFYNLKSGELIVGLLDVNGVNFVQPGDGPILNLRFVPRDSKSFDLNSIQIEKATFVNMQAQELFERVVK